MKINISNTISSFEAKTHLGQLLQRVKAGERITILKHNAPIAVLIPVVNSEVSNIQETIENLILLSKGKKLNDLSIKDLTEEGRR